LRILLTGAEGFTGRHFADQARATGHDILPLQADLRDAQSVREALRGEPVDAVVHLAAIAFVAHRDEQAFYDVNLFGTLNLLEAVRAAGIKPSRVLLASSANIYGNCERSPIAEHQAPAPVNHYAMSKLAMEHLAQAKAGDLPLVIARPFNYTGPGQSGDFVIPKLVDHFRRRAETIALGNLHVEREYNDVRFACGAYLALLKPGAPLGTFNICSGKTHSLGAVIDELSRLTGHTPRIESDPALVRPNEIHRLCGDPARLDAACPGLSRPPLAETLRWMLEHDL
jgi:nucleoside-diphosphate-sugar epimerase